MGDNELVNKSDLEIQINKIIQILREFSHSEQADYMNRLLGILANNDKSSFTDMSKTVDIWGGSGAVWEVCIQDSNKEKEVQNAIIKFAELLNNNRISNHGINSIKSLFERK